MRPEEIMFRSKQELFKVVERLTGRPVAMPSGITLSPCRLSASGSGDDALAGDEGEQEVHEEFWQKAADRFFPGASDSGTVGRIADYCRREREHVIQSADAICRGEFPVLGYGLLRFGTGSNGLGEMDWHLDPMSGQRSPEVHWSRLNPLDRMQVGDSKVVWEVNRHQWMLDIGQAYRYTGDEHYATVFARLLEDWMRKNPPGVGINWSSALEVSMRLMSWCWALFLFRGSQALSAGFLGKVLAGIRIHASYVERYCSRYFSPNTHLTGEALGLFYAGTLFPEWREAARWQALGRNILEQQIERQVKPDGVYFEQSTRYQYYTLEIYLHYLILAERNKIPVGGPVRERLGLMLDFVLAVRNPNGAVPPIGDADGGWLLPFLRRTPEDFTGIFSVAAVVLRRQDCAWAAVVPGIETLWLLGPAGAYSFFALEPVPAPHRQLKVFREGGYAVMQSTAQHDALQLIMDFGPLGCGNSSGHGHADLLSVQCSAFGEPFLVDPGTGCYTAEPEWRDHFRSTHAHNTLVLDKCEQASPEGPFSWDDVSLSGKLIDVLDTEQLVGIDACHEAWRDGSSKLIHRRRTLFVESRYWLIIDDISPAVDDCVAHEVSLNYQFAELAVTQEESGWIRAKGKRRGALLMRLFSSGGIDTTIATGHRNPIRGWLSPDYGRCIAAPALRWVCSNVLPTRLVSLLLPVANADETPPVVVPSFDNGRVSGIRFGLGGNNGVWIDDNHVGLYCCSPTVASEGGCI